MSEEGLQALTISKGFRNKEVLKGLSLSVRRGEVVGLLGPNGSGKTTTFNVVAGFYRPDGGKVTLDGEDITDLPTYLRARKGIGYLPQESSVFRKMTAEENIMSVLETLKISHRERKERLERLLGELRISHLAKRKAYKLSGGERRRLEITRSLVISPSFLLFDEPFTGIDPITCTDIQQIILGLKSSGIGILISDHNVRETLKVCDSAYIISNGQILLSGPPKKILSSAKVKKIYLGENFRLSR